jgi:hypothetical protein
VPFDEWIEDRDGHLIPQAGQDFPALERVSAREAPEYTNVSTQTDGPSLPSPPATEDSDGENEGARSPRSTVSQLSPVGPAPNASTMIEEAPRRTPTWWELTIQAMGSRVAANQRQEDGEDPMEVDGEENI